jgi:hypothetical protein
VVLSLHSPSSVSTFPLIDPLSDMERTIFELGPVRFAVSEERDGVLVNERHVPQIENQLATRCLDGQQLSELPNILCFNSATEGEHDLIILCSLNSEHASPHI